MKKVWKVIALVVFAVLTAMGSRSIIHNIQSLREANLRVIIMFGIDALDFLALALLTIKALTSLITGRRARRTIGLVILYAIGSILPLAYIIITTGQFQVSSILLTLGYIVIVGVCAKLLKSE